MILNKSKGSASKPRPLGRVVVILSVPEERPATTLFLLIVFYIYPGLKQRYRPLPLFGIV